MSILVNIAAFFVGVFLIVTVVGEMKKKRITESQSVGWLISAIVIILLGMFPKIIPLVANLFGVWYPPTILLVMVIVLLVFIIFNHTTNISQLTNRVNELTELVTLLEHERENTVTKDAEKTGKKELDEV